jgi:hypothetical protein
MDKLFIGIDPGVTGAIAIINSKKILNIIDYPRDNTKRLLSVYKCFEGKDCLFMLEKTVLLPNQSQERQLVYAETFFKHKFCMDYFNFNYQVISPNSWKKEFNLQTSRKKGEEKQNNKKQNYEMALYLFNDAGKYLRVQSKDHNRADALLLAEYARRIS